MLWGLWLVVLISLFSTLRANHVRDHVVVEITVIVSAASAFMAAVFALVDGREVPTVL